MRTVAVVVAVMMAAGQALAAQPRDGVGPPPASRAPFRSEPLVAEAAAGLSLGFVMSWGMARIGATVLGPRGGEDPGLAGAVAGFAAGLALGSSLGVHLVARRCGFPARYAEAAAGAVAGVLLLPALPLDIDRGATWALIYAVPTLMATAASTLGSSSRWTGPAVRPVGTGVGVAMGVTF
jgi:hypothetical protein